MIWKQHFTVEENMVELEVSCRPPPPVVRASGHVGKFHDLLARDIGTGNGFRTDYLQTDRINKFLDSEDMSRKKRDEIIRLRGRLDKLTQKEMNVELARYGANGPETENPLTSTYFFNLIFQTAVRPPSLLPSLLRPETARGSFVFFKQFLEYMGGTLPFAGAQIGFSFRSEVLPKAQLFPLCELQPAMVEHSVNADDEQLPKPDSIRDVENNI